MEADQALQALPGCSRYHVSRYLALSFLYMTGPWHVYAILFIGADPGHICKSAATNSTDTSVYYPDGECRVTVQQEGQNHTEACPAGYAYGAEFTSTVLTEWDLVCDKDFMVDLSSTILMIGQACGAALVTPFSDRFGRKWVLLISTWIQGVVGVALALVDNFVLFAVLRFFIGFLNMAIALVTYVMVTESFSAHHRTQPSIAVNMAWSLGLMMLALFGYLVRDWRHLQLLISVPKFISIFYICFLDESIPWLVAKGKYKQVEGVIHQAGRLNSATIPQSFHRPDGTCDMGDNREDQDHIDMEIVHECETSESTLTGSDKDTKPCTVVDLFRTPKMRRYTFIMFYLWTLPIFGDVF